MTIKNPSQFGDLIKQYRLRAQFKTLIDLGDALAEKGLVFEDSTLSKWQAGNRIPYERDVLLTLAEVLAHHGGISSIKDINLLLESAGQGYITDDESERFPSLRKESESQAPFQAPWLTPYFSGREVEIKQIYEHIMKNPSAFIILCGPGGVGKTTLAISAAHSLKSRFPDGIIWSRTDAVDPMSLLAKIALSFGTDISSIKDYDSRADIVRSLLSNKKALVVFDNVQSSAEIRPLLPGGSGSAIIATSRNSALEIFSEGIVINLKPFNSDETVTFFSRCFSSDWASRNGIELKKLSSALGNLPLALNIIAKKILLSGEPLENIIISTEKKRSILQTLRVEDIDVRSSFELSYNILTEEEKRVFSSLSIFEGTDISTLSVAAANELPIPQASQILETLVQKSLVEYSLDGRYRLHPLLKLFAGEKSPTKKMHLSAARYFYTRIKDEYEAGNFSLDTRQKDLESILAILKWCYEKRERKMFFDLWFYVSKLLMIQGMWKELEKTGRVVYENSSVIPYQKINADCCINILSRIAFWKGDLFEARDWAQKGLKIAQTMHHEYFIAEAENQLGNIAFHESKYSEAETLLESALEIFKKLGAKPQIAKSLLYLAQIPYRK